MAWGTRILAGTGLRPRELSALRSRKGRDDAPSLVREATGGSVAALEVKRAAVDRSGRPRASDPTFAACGSGN